MNWFHSIVLASCTSFVLLLTSSTASAAEPDETILKIYEGDSISHYILHGDGPKILPSLAEPGVVVFDYFMAVGKADSSVAWDKLSKAGQARFLKAPEVSNESEAKKAVIDFWKQLFACRAMGIESVEYNKARATVSARFYEFNDNSGRELAIKLIKENGQWVLTGEAAHWLGHKKKAEK